MSEPSQPPARSAAPQLRARALRLLAQREHSRSELRRKLLLQATATATDTAADGPAGNAGAGHDAALEREAVVAVVESVLDWLEAQDFLSQRRFVDSRVHLRAPRFGISRIRQELARHGVQMEADAAQHLQATELQRAQSVWLRKFKTPAPDAAARARQMRFLAGRGFSPDVIRQVLRGDAGADDA